MKALSRARKPLWTLVAGIFVGLLCLASGNAALSASVTYTYDEAGRLKKSTYDDGTVTSYDLDAAGNRKNVGTGSPPGVPPSISVPSSNSTGGYTISWTAPTGTVTRYDLYEATNSSFSGETQVYTGTALLKAISGKGNGTYYYRVLACNTVGCSAPRAGATGVVVLLPPGTPGSITVPSSSTTGSYNIGWTAGSGTITSYTLQESTNSGFTSPTTAYTGSGISAPISGRGDGSYYYRVQACNASGCSGFRTGATPIVVQAPPGAPGSISAPSSSSTGAYTISWTAGTGTITSFEAYESTSSSFATQTPIYTGSGLSQPLTGRSNGVYYYRVRACNTYGCGNYTASSGTTVLLPPGSPASINVPSGSSSSSYTISWAAGTGTIASYELQESTTSGFTSPTVAYTGAGTSAPLVGRADGSYYYRVRACNASGCSSYTTGATPIVVLAPPGTPSSISAPSGSNTGLYTVSWGTSTGTVASYEVTESINPSFSPESSIYSGLGTSKSVSVSLNATYYYRVRACNSNGCSNYAATTGTTVLLPPSAPGSITVPPNSATGSWTISFTAASGPVSQYELYEATDAAYSNATLVASGMALSVPISSKPDGNYYYRVRACNGGGCSGYVSGGPLLAQLPPGQPGAISVPASSTTGAYTVSWGAATGTVTYYALYEGVLSDWPPRTLIYSGTATSFSFSTHPDGQFFYRVYACNSLGCGTNRDDSVGINVNTATLPTITFGDRVISRNIGSGAIASFQVLSSGDIYASTATSNTLVDVGDWMSPKNASAASQFEITVLGSNCPGPTNTVNGASNPLWSIATTAPPNICGFRLEFRDIPTHTLRGAGVIQLRAQ